MIDMDPATRAYLQEIGRRGGRKSRRILTSEQAREMVRVRRARRAYREFHARCFWSYPVDLAVTHDDIAWVVDQLRRYGGRDAWLVAEALCR